MGYEMNVKSADIKTAIDSFKATVSHQITDKDGNITTEYFYDEKLIESVISYVLRMLNDSARLGHIDYGEFITVLKKANDGLFDEIYLKNYVKGESVYKKDSLRSSAEIFMYLLFTRVLKGRDRDLALAEIESRQKKVIMGVGGGN